MKMTAKEAILFAKANNIKLTAFQVVTFEIGAILESFGIIKSEIEYIDDGRRDTTIIVVDTNNKELFKHTNWRD